jgi:hypothetical protein
MIPSGTLIDTHIISINKAPMTNLNNFELKNVCLNNKIIKIGIIESILLVNRWNMIKSRKISFDLSKMIN